MFLSTMRELLIAVATVCHVMKAYSQTVNTTYGRVVGLRQSALGKDVDVFYGIPFAKPPVGLLRFQHPVPTEHWEPRILNANKSKASCYQIITDHPNPLEQVPQEVSEDCLYLNIFAPVSKETARAVMVWIFGGAFTSGSINSPMFDGQILASSNDVIVVTVNYRLGVLGFLYLDSDTAPGNMGLLDQQLAMKWVFENIDRFGGDPGRITIFGQSAGAGSVSLHLLSPLSQPYFTSGIMESGSPLTSWDLLTDAETKIFATAIAKKANCTSIKNNADIYECLNAKSPESLINLQSHLAPGSNVPFGPVVDGYFLPDRPLSILEGLKMKNCSILVGVNQNEGALFLYYGHPSVFQWKNNLTITDGQFMADLTSMAKSQSGDNLTVNALYQEYVLTRVPSDRNYVTIADEVLGDFSFKCPVTRFAGYYAQISDVYMYSFNHRLSSARVPDWMGVKHGAELPLVWGRALDPYFGLNFTAEEKTLSRKMMTYWTNFAKFGSPNGEDSGLLNWPRYETMDERYIRLDVGSNLATGQGLRRRQCVFMYKTIPMVASLEHGKSSMGTTREPCAPPVGGTGNLGSRIVSIVTVTLSTLVVWLTGQ